MYAHNTYILHIQYTHSSPNAEETASPRVSKRDDCFCIRMYVCMYVFQCVLYLCA